MNEKIILAKPGMFVGEIQSSHGELIEPVSYVLRIMEKLNLNQIRISLESYEPGGFQPGTVDPLILMRGRIEAEFNSAT